MRYVATGMTLRAYFAAHAPEVPNGFMHRSVEAVHTDVFSGFKSVRRETEPRIDTIVRWRLAYADAMLKALK